MYSTALLATDLSPASDAIVECAHTLRSLGVRRIVLLHALGLKHMPEVAPLVAGKAGQAVADQETKLMAHGFDVSTTIVPGPPAWEISDVADREGVSIIVMGATGRSLVQQIVLGGVTTAVLHRARCPVLILHPRLVDDDGNDRCEVVCSEPLTHVLFGTDFSDTAEHAFSYLEGMATQGVRRVTLVHVQDRARIRADDLELLKQFDQIDRARLDRLRDALTERGVEKVDIEVPFGSPVQELVARSRQDDVTLVVMGTQGRSFFGELLLGGVAHQVARQASAPTLLVPPKADWLDPEN
jgi:nucleotide-binding universal stress UspA family protein